MNSTRKSLRALKAGTRSSPLALIQTEEALLKLGARFGLAFETVPFSSPGDRDKASDLRASPPDFFTKDLDDALLDGRIDLAVHSAKDMPERLPDGLDFLWLPWREDPRDVLVLREGAVLPGPDAKLRIGVSSARREAYCRKRFPNAELLPIRGNIADRVAQLDAGRFDLLLMAAAGLARLGLQNRISEFIPLSELEPPPGQGVLAISFRKDEETLRKLRLAFVKTVVFAGAGPGPKELLTLASAEALKCCDACLYDSLIDESALSLLPSGAIAIAVGKRKGAHSFKQEDICRLLCDFARQGKAVTRLKGGDPGLFGRLAEETDALNSLALPFRVIPGVSSLTAATSATGLLLTRRGVSRGFSAFTPRKANSGDFEAVSQKERAELPLAVFMGASETAKLCAQLIAEGKAASTPAALVLGAATPEIKILAGSLESLPAKAEAEASQLPGLLVIGEAAAEKHLFGSCGALASKRTLLVCSEILAEKATRTVRQFSGVPIHFNMTELQAQNGAIEKLASFDKIDWLLCSSPSSARILIDGLLKLGCDLRRLPKLLSCGPGTSEEFRKYGLLPDAQAEAPFGGEAILRCAAEHLEKGSRVLRVRSDAAGTSLGDGIQELGMELVDAPIYRSVSVKRERLPDFDFAFFSSSSEVESFAASFGGGPLAGKKAVAIGKPTQMALRALCPGAEVLAPEESTAEAAIAALAWSQVADMVCGFIPKGFPSMLMYLCPALMDWLLFYVLFAVLYAAGARGLSIWECTLVGMVLQLAYMPGSVLAGHLLNSGNAKKFLLRSTVVCGILSVFCLKIEAVAPLMAALACFGVANAFFFNSFQTFMRSEASLGLTLKSSVSMYNFAWSIGAGVGILTAGILYELGPAALIGTALASVAAIMALLLLHRSSSEKRITGEGVIEEGSPGARPVASSYVVIGWLMVFTAQFAQRPLCTFLPPLFAKDGTSSLLASLPLFAMFALQAFVALFMWRFRDIMYRRTPLLIVQALAALGFAAIWLRPSYAVCLGSLFLLGVYSGFAYFCSVYYVSNSKRSSFNIGVNEALVGLGSISGIFAGELWMRWSGSSSQIYLMCAVGALLSTGLQALVASYGKAPAPKAS